MDKRGVFAERYRQRSSARLAVCILGRWSRSGFPFRIR